MNILFLNCGRRCELISLFRDALNRRGGGFIYGTDIDINAPAMYKVDEAAVFPRTESDEFPEVLAEFCRRRDIRLLIPSIDPDLTALDRHREKIKSLIPELRLLIPPHETIALSRDKRASRGRFAELGALVPAEIKKISKDMKMPVFVKPPDGSAGQGARRIDTFREFEAALKERPDLMVEEVVDGPEYTVDVICDFSGHAVEAVPRLRLKVRGGEVSRGVIEMRKDLIELSKRLAEGFGAHGPVTLQFRSPSPGVYVAMEMNARMGGGLPLSVAAGADWPGMILDLAAGGKINDPGLRIADGMMMNRFDASLFTMPNITPLPTLKWTRDIHLTQKKSILKGVKTFIFDMDDTLYPESDFVMGGYSAAAKRMWELKRIDIEPVLRTLFKNGERTDIFRKAVHMIGFTDFDEPLLMELVKAYRSHTPSLRPYNDCDSLRKLRSSGFTVGLLTDGWGDVQEAKFKALGVSALFDFAIFTDRLGGKEFWKPSAEPFIHAAKEYKFTPESAVYVGDNPEKDFYGAKKAGMKTVRIRRMYGEHISKYPVNEDFAPHACIYSLREIEKALNI